MCIEKSFQSEGLFSVSQLMVATCEPESIVKCQWVQRTKGSSQAIQNHKFPISEKGQKLALKKTHIFV
jgi:hypothetical protein